MNLIFQFLFGAIILGLIISVFSIFGYYLNGKRYSDNVLFLGLSVFTFIGALLIGIFSGDWYLFIVCSLVYGLPMLLVKDENKSTTTLTSKNKFLRNQISDNHITPKEVDKPINVLKNEISTKPSDHAIVKVEKSVQVKLDEFREKRKVIENQKSSLAQSIKENNLKDSAQKITKESKTTYFLGNKKHYFDGEKFIPIDD